MTDLPKLKPCFYCGSDNLLMRQIGTFCLYCDRCTYQSGQYNTQKELTENHNRIYDLVKGTNEDSTYLTDKPMEEEQYHYGPNPPESAGSPKGGMWVKIMEGTMINKHIIERFEKLEKRLSDLENKDTPEEKDDDFLFLKEQLLYQMLKGGISEGKYKKYRGKYEEVLRTELEEK